MEKNYVKVEAEAEGQEFEVARTIYSDRTIFGIQNAFSWRFLRFNNLDWKKLLGFRNMQEKLENYSLSFFHEENYMIGQIVMKLPRLLSLLI